MLHTLLAILTLCLCNDNKRFSALRITCSVKGGDACVHKGLEVLHCSLA